MTQTELLNETLQYLVDKGPADALAYIEKHYAHCDEPYSSQVYNFRYCLAAQSGRTEQALDILNEAVMVKGLWYRPEVFQDSDLDTLRDKATFKKCAEVSEKLYAEAKSKAKTLCTWDRVTADRILMALHGNQQNLDDAKKSWSFAEELGWQTVFVQSKELDSIGLYRWDDEGSGPYQLEAVCGSIGWYDYDIRALAGFSSGCNVILRAIAGGMLECERIVLAAPWIPMLDSQTEKLYKNLIAAGTSVTIFCGSDDDDCLNYAKTLAEGCKQNAIAVEYIELDGLDHQIPKNFPELAKPYLI